MQALRAILADPALCGSPTDHIRLEPQAPFREVGAHGGAPPPASRPCALGLANCAALMRYALARGWLEG